MSIEIIYSYKFLLALGPLSNTQMKQKKAKGIEDIKLSKSRTSSINF